jgi:hypothetical protein
MALFDKIPLFKYIIMKYLMFIGFVFLTSCYDKDADEFKENCPYTLDYSGHYLRIPITISPHKLHYKVGDTLSINTVFSDSIYDLGTKHFFKIEGFPFKPSSLLFRFTDSHSYDSGYSINELNIDSIYNHVYYYSSNYADGYRANAIYDSDKNEYRFESEMILKEAGRYILLFTDLFQEYLGSGNSDLNADADAIRFEGQCLDDKGKPLLRYYLCSMIDSGDDNLEQFENELIYLDEEVYGGKLAHIGSDALDPLYPGSIPLEFSGFFGFEVVK